MQPWRFWSVSGPPALRRSARDHMHGNLGILILGLLMLLRGIMILPVGNTARLPALDAAAGVLAVGHVYHTKYALFLGRVLRANNSSIRRKILIWTKQASTRSGRCRVMWTCRVPWGVRGRTGLKPSFVVCDLEQRRFLSALPNCGAWLPDLPDAKRIFYAGADVITLGQDW